MAFVNLRVPPWRYGEGIFNNRRPLLIETMVKIGVGEGQHMLEMSGAGRSNSDSPRALDRKRLRLVAKDLPDGSRTLLHKNAGNHTLAGLQELRQDRDLCDVVFKVEEGEILAHRNILVINSEYFRSMFRYGFHETYSKEIPIPPESVDKHSAETLIDFMYTGQFSVTPATVQGLIMAADHWQMMEAKELCVEYMQRQIDTQNCLGVLSFAQMYSCEKLAQKCLQLIKQRFPIVAESAEFLHLSRVRLEEILSFTDLQLGHEGEDVVLKALFRWLEHNTQERVDDLPSLLRKVRLTATTKECRRRLLDNNPIVQARPEMRQLIEAMLEEPTEVRNAQTTLYVIGGFLQSRTGPKCPRLRSMECLDPITNQWTPCASLPMLSSGAVAFSIHGHLFCAAYEPIDAGHASIMTQTGIFEYSFIQDEWRDARENFSPEALECIDTCLQAEGALAVCHRTNTIYTVSHSEVSSISINLIDGNVYCRNVQLLPRPHAYFSEQQRLHSAIVVDERLYVLGGDRHDAGSDPVPTARVIMLDPQSHSWVSRANMLERRAKMAVAELGGHIYACGGFNVRRLATMERYDPATDIWTAVAPMNKFRSHHQVLVLQNKIWAMGGKSYSYNNGGARKVINLCEVYDPETDTWTEGQPMKSARCGFAAVAI